ncbi:PDDEXK nuclease domain-containing protein [Mucilaginibacter sp.]|uniref:PDDEXK nuclease domain-containing protein n=1 Tax=Mucilaginibacter sp. TaxID=1882438 RepID=UPI0025FBB110|nr:PDDEXK nuclease domain-containing protein [Mucilaginibacter sp.]
MSKLKKINPEIKLLSDISQLIEESKLRIAYTANTALALLYWNIGTLINNEILENKRAEYGKQIVVTLSRQLGDKYGASFSDKNLRRMMQFATVFPDEKIVVSALRQLSWSHFIALIPLKDALQREFYAEMCRVERWSVNVLREKIDSMLFERTAISKRPKQLIKDELSNLRNNDNLTPDLVFRDPYILDFLGLKNTYSEKDLEHAILKELERFILELGQGFTFVERQKRMIIDGEDFKLDLLFYHRKLKRLIALELKLGKFKAAYKSQMELYLRWLEKNEMQDGEETPLGLILCAEGNKEQIELLQLDKAGIKIAEYFTELPDEKLLRAKLHQTIEFSKKQIENSSEPE